MKTPDNHYFASLFLLTWLCTLVVLPACNGVDYNEDYITETKAWFFLTSDSSGQKAIQKIEGPAIFPTWNEEVGIPGNAVTDFVVNTQDAWICSQSRNSLYHIDLANTQPDNLYQLGSFSPDAIAVTPKYIVMTDSLGKKLGFLKLKNREFFQLTTSLMPSRILYNGGKLYVKEGCCNIGIYNVQALAQTGMLNTGFPIIDLKIDKHFNVHLVVQEPAITSRFIIDANADAFTMERGIMAFDKFIFSPYYNQNYGKEFLTDINLLNQKLLPPVIADSVENMEADFFEAILFHQWGDSLFRFDLNAQKRTGSFPFQGRIHKMYAYRDYEAR